MSLVDSVKDIADLIKKAGDMDLYRRIVELQAEIISLSADTLEARQENAELKAKLDLKEAMRFRFPYYYQGDDPHPFCKHCWEVDGIATHLRESELWKGRPRRFCHNCRQAYYDY